MNLALQAPLAPEQLEQCLGLFRISRILHAAARLGLPALLAGESRDVQEIAHCTHTDPAAMRAFLRALAAWGVFDVRDGRYATNAFSRRLVPGVAGGVSDAMVAGWAGSDLVFEAFAGIQHTLATGESGLHRTRRMGFHRLLEREPAEAALYGAAMQSTEDAFQAQAQMVDLAGCRMVVDVGGGRGGLLQAVLRRYPDACGICFDLPHAVDGAKLPADLAGRMAFRAGDAFERIPAGADAYLMCTVLRCFRDAQAVELLRRVRRAMRPGTRLACFEMVMPANHDDPALALTHLTARIVYGGADRSLDEFVQLFAQAGLCLQEARPGLGAIHALTCTPA